MPSSKKAIDLVGRRSELKLKLDIKMTQSIAPTRNIPPHVKGDSVSLYN